MLHTKCEFLTDSVTYSTIKQCVETVFAKCLPATHRTSAHDAFFGSNRENCAFLFNFTRIQITKRSKISLNIWNETKVIRILWKKLRNRNVEDSVFIKIWLISHPKSNKFFYYLKMYVFGYEFIFFCINKIIKPNEAKYSQI